MMLFRTSCKIPSKQLLSDFSIYVNHEIYLTNKRTYKVVQNILIWDIKSIFVHGEFDICKYYLSYQDLKLNRIHININFNSESARKF